jgi:hypothetical protein
MLNLWKSLFSREKKKKSFDKYGDVLKNKITTKESRLEAIEALESAKDPQVVPALLMRFEMVLESGLQDAREKEKCMNIIVSHGDAAKADVFEYIEKKHRIAWPLKVAEKICSHDEYIDLLLNSLKPDMVVFDNETLEKNEEILLALKEKRDGRICSKVLPFLSLRDEGLRMAAVECLEEQAQQDLQARDIFLELSQTAPTDDNSRFIGVIQSIVKKHNWQGYKQP